MDTELKKLMKAEAKAYAALMRDPAIKSDPLACHTPALWDAYIAAANAERAYRRAHGL